MKRPIAAFLIFACAFLLFAGTVFAGAAPDAASYFTHPGYNKSYTGEDGLSHTSLAAARLFFRGRSSLHGQHSL